MKMITKFINSEKKIFFSLWLKKNSRNFICIESLKKIKMKFKRSYQEEANTSAHVEVCGCQMNAYCILYDDMWSLDSPQG